jgi:hypothetical protein
VIKPVWKMISLFLALAVFLGVGVVELLGGEELLWVVGKAVASFFACWIVLGTLGNMLLAVLNRQEAEPVTGVTLDEKG